MKNLTSIQKTLLNLLVKDEKKHNSKLYSAGPYWKYKTKKILYCLKKVGISEFRGLNSGVGTSYTDNIVLDQRNELSLKGRILSSVTYLPIIKRIYEEQIALHKSIINEYITQNAKIHIENESVRSLISKYNVKDSTEFGCTLKFRYNEQEYSCHYLNLCHRIDIINTYFDFNKIFSFFEIGGGFGANIHLLLNNFKNIKKILYLDIIPNLLVGTEYLRFFYGSAVKDYNSLKNKKKIAFSNNEDLEIFCIAPWQIEDVSAVIDHFHNASSFQEMPKHAIQNYAKYIYKFLNNKGSISLISHIDLNNFFNNSLTVKKFPNLVEDDPNTKILVSK